MRKQARYIQRSLRYWLDSIDHATLHNNTEVSKRVSSIKQYAQDLLAVDTCRSKDCDALVSAIWLLFDAAGCLFAAASSEHLCEEVSSSALQQCYHCLEILRWPLKLIDDDYDAPPFLAGGHPKAPGKLQQRHLI
jgi:hypothetical protein